MTTRHLLRWLVSVVAVSLIGCGGSQPTEPATATPVIVAPVTDDLRPVEPTRPTQPTAPAKPADPLVTLPPDTGAKAVAKALIAPPPFGPESPTVKTPTPYTSPLDRGELPLPSVSPRPLPPSGVPTGNTAKPSPPTQGPLLNPFAGPLPEGKHSDRPLVKAASPPNPRAADVPQMAWTKQERASLDDPTADLSAVRVIETPLPVPVVELPFLRLFIPNPFEYAEQLKGKLGTEREFGVTPSK